MHNYILYWHTIPFWQQCAMLNSSSFTIKSWFCILCKEAVLSMDAFIINEMYYFNQITFQPMNTHFSFENNKAP